MREICFDTETTGLDTFRDDIIQIAAMRIRGEKVLGQFMVHIETEREIPAMLGDIVNPIIEERKTADILSHEDALSRFSEFVEYGRQLMNDARFMKSWNEHHSFERFRGLSSDGQYRRRLYYTIPADKI